MKICVAQIKPVKGDIEANLVAHEKLIELAVAKESNIIIFPELSLTGYEPEFAKELATTPDDDRLDHLQAMSNEMHITIGVGLPIRTDKGICISMILLQPHQVRQVYSKKYLHQDEEPYFVRGENSVELVIKEINLAIAICYELSVPEHAESAFQQGAEIYLVSVAKHSSGVERAAESLAEIARKYSMMVVMSNSVGPSYNFVGAGKSSVWNNKGKLLGQLDDSHEGILIIDTLTSEVIATKLDDW